MSSISVSAQVKTTQKRVAGSTKFGSNKFSIGFAIKETSVAEIRQFCIGLIDSEVDKQIQLGNEPTRLIVDGREGVPLEKFDKNARVLFGHFLERGAMRLVEQQINKQLKRTRIHFMYRFNGSKWQTITKPNQTTNGWGWVFYEKKGDKGKPVSQSTQSSLLPGSVLVYMPMTKEAVELASWLNHAFVTHGHKRQVGTKRGNARRAATGKGDGFIASTTAKLRRHKLLKNFTVRGGYTNKHAGPGETWNPQGKGPLTPYISIVPKSQSKRSRLLN